MNNQILELLKNGKLVKIQEEITNGILLTIFGIETNWIEVGDTVIFRKIPLSSSDPKVEMGLSKVVSIESYPVQLSE